MASQSADISGLAGRYATAVFELAEEEKAVEAVERDFVSLREMIATNPELDRFVRAPIYSREEQEKGMDALLRRMEASPLTVRFVLTLARKRRLFALADIIRSFEALLSRQRGEIDAQVVSAQPLNDAETAELKKVLKSKLGRDARLELNVEPSLLGGLIVKVGSRMIDSSLRTKLEGLRTAMRG